MAKKKNQTKPRASRRKDIIRSGQKWVKQRTWKTIERSMTQSWFSENINKIDKPLAKFIKWKRSASPNQQSEMKKERLQPTPRGNTKDSKKPLRTTMCQWKGNLKEERDKLLEMPQSPRLKKEELENVNRPITGNEIESV